MLNSENFIKVPFNLMDEMLNFLFGMKGYSHNRQKKECYPHILLSCVDNTLKLLYIITARSCLLFLGTE